MPCLCESVGQFICCHVCDTVPVVCLYTFFFVKTLCLSVRQLFRVYVSAVASMCVLVSLVAGICAAVALGASAACPVCVCVVLCVSASVCIVCIKGSVSVCVSGGQFPLVHELNGGRVTVSVGVCVSVSVIRALDVRQLLSVSVRVSVSEYQFDKVCWWYFFCVYADVL